MPIIHHLFLKEKSIVENQGTEKHAWCGPEALSISQVSQNLLTKVYDTHCIQAIQAQFKHNDNLIKLTNTLTGVCMCACLRQNYKESFQCQYLEK